MKTRGYKSMAILEEALSVNIGNLEAYHGVWALSTVGKEGQLKCTHMAWPIVYGKNPIWVIATIEGKFVRYASSKESIQKMYPRLTWRRWMVRWSMLEAQHHSIPKRREEVEEVYGARPPKLLAPKNED